MADDDAAETGFAKVLAVRAKLAAEWNKTDTEIADEQQVAGLIDWNPFKDPPPAPAPDPPADDVRTEGEKRAEQLWLTRARTTKNWFDVWAAVRDGESGPAAVEAFARDHKAGRKDAYGYDLSSKWDLLPDNEAVTPRWRAPRRGGAFSSLPARRTDGKLTLAELLRTPGITLAHLAAARDDLATVRALVASGACVTARNREGESPADVATAMCRTACYALLAQAPQPPKDIVTWDGCWEALRERCDEEAAVELSKFREQGCCDPYGQDVNTRRLASYEWFAFAGRTTGYSLAHFAAHLDKPLCLDELRRSGAVLDAPHIGSAKRHDEETPLSIAKARGYARCVRAILAGDDGAMPLPPPAPPAYGVGGLPHLTAPESATYDVFGRQGGVGGVRKFGASGGAMARPPPAAGTGPVPTWTALWETVRDEPDAIAAAAIATFDAAHPSGKDARGRGLSDRKLDNFAFDPHAGATLAHLAAAKGKPKCVAALLACGADLKVLDTTGDDALDVINRAFPHFELEDVYEPPLPPVLWTAVFDAVLTKTDGLALPLVGRWCAQGGKDAYGRDGSHTTTGIWGQRTIQEQAAVRKLTRCLGKLNALAAETAARRAALARGGAAAAAAAESQIGVVRVEGKGALRENWVQTGAVSRPDWRKRGGQKGGPQAQEAQVSVATTSGLGL